MAFDNQLLSGLVDEVKATTQTSYIETKLVVVILEYE